LPEYRIWPFQHQEGIDTTTPAGKAMFQMCGVFAEFERAMIRERVAAGLASARSDCKSLRQPTIGANMKEVILNPTVPGKNPGGRADRTGVGISESEGSGRGNAEATGGAKVA
jgi:Resolvase, N terminal domain